MLSKGINEACMGHITVYALYISYYNDDKALLKAKLTIICQFRNVKQLIMQWFQRFICSYIMLKACA